MKEILEKEDKKKTNLEIEKADQAVCIQELKKKLYDLNKILENKNLEIERQNQIIYKLTNNLNYQETNREEMTLYIFDPKLTCSLASLSKIPIGKEGILQIDNLNKINKKTKTMETLKNRTSLIYSSQKKDSMKLMHFAENNENINKNRESDDKIQIVDIDKQNLTFSKPQFLFGINVFISFH